MKTRNALKTLSRGAVDAKLGAGPLAQVADQLLAAAEAAEQDRFARHAQRESYAQGTPAFDVLQRVVKQAQADALVDCALPAILRFDFYSMLRSASEQLPSDRGVRQGMLWAKKLWTDEPMGTLSVGEVAQLREHYRNTQRGSKVASIIEDEVARVGFTTLPLRKLTVLASRLAGKNEGEVAAAFGAEGISGNRPEQIRAQAYVRALASLPAVKVEADAMASKDIVERVAHRIQAQDYTAPSSADMMPPADMSMSADAYDEDDETNFADPIAAGGEEVFEEEVFEEEIPHDEMEEEVIEMESPNTGEPMVVELSAGEDFGEMEPWHEGVGSSAPGIIEMGGLDIVGQLMDFEELDEEELLVDAGPVTEEVPDPTDPEKTIIVTLEPGMVEEEEIITEEMELPGDELVEEYDEEDDLVLEAKAAGLSPRCAVHGASRARCRCGLRAASARRKVLTPYTVWAWSNGVRGQTPVERFGAPSMAHALRRIARFGVDGQVACDLRAPEREAVIFLDDHNFLHVATSASEAFDPKINEQQPPQMDIGEDDGKEVLVGDAKIKQNRAKKKSRVRMSRSEIERRCASLGWNAQKIEDSLLDGGEVATDEPQKGRSIWALAIDAGDEIVLNRIAMMGAAEETHKVASWSLLDLDDAVDAFMARVAATIQTPEDKAVAWWKSAEDKKEVDDREQELKRLRDAEVGVVDKLDEDKEEAEGDKDSHDKARADEREENRKEELERLHDAREGVEKALDDAEDKARSAARRRAGDEKPYFRDPKKPVTPADFYKEYGVETELPTKQPKKPLAEDPSEYMEVVESESETELPHPVLASRRAADLEIMTEVPVAATAELPLNLSVELTPAVPPLMEEPMGEELDVIDLLLPEKMAYHVQPLFKMACAKCAAVNEYVMPSKAASLACGSCGVRMSEKYVRKAFGNGKAQENGEYVITAQTWGKGEREQALNAKKVLQKIQQVAGNVEGKRNGANCLEVVASLDTAGLNRIQKVLNDVYGIRVEAVRKMAQAQSVHGPAQEAPVSMGPAMDAIGTQIPGSSNSWPEQIDSSGKIDARGSSEKRATDEPPGSDVPATDSIGNNINGGQVPAANPQEKQPGPGILSSTMSTIKDTLGAVQSGMGGGNLATNTFFGSKDPTVDPMDPTDPMNTKLPPKSKAARRRKAQFDEEVMVEEEMIEPMPMVEEEVILPPEAGVPPAPIVELGAGIGPELAEAIGGTMQLLREQYIGPATAIKDFMQEHGGLLDQFGDPNTPGRHAAEAELLRIMGDVYATPTMTAMASRKRAEDEGWPKHLDEGRFTEYCKREGFDGPCKACADKAFESDDDSVRGMASFYMNTVHPEGKEAAVKFAWEAPKVNTQTGDYVKGVTVDDGAKQMEADQEEGYPDPSKIPAQHDMAKNKGVDMSDTSMAGGRQTENLGAFNIPKPKQTHDMAKNKGVNLPSIEGGGAGVLGPDSSTGNGPFGKLMNSVSKKAPGAVRSK